MADLSRRRLAFALALSLTPFITRRAAAQGGQPAFHLPREERVPGGVAILTMNPPPRLQVDGKQVLTLPWHKDTLVIVGIPLDRAPGPWTLENAADPGKPVVIEVKDKQYRTQQLKVAPGQVNLSPEDEARVARETEKVRAGGTVGYFRVADIDQFCQSPRCVDVVGFVLTRGPGGLQIACH